MKHCTIRVTKWGRVRERPEGCSVVRVMCRAGFTRSWILEQLLGESCVRSQSIFLGVSQHEADIRVSSISGVEVLGSSGVAFS